jgi:hypothetical protein
MANFVEWLGPSLRKMYRGVLMRPANWRMITMLSSLDEQAEKRAEASAKKVAEPEQGGIAEPSRTGEQFPKTEIKPQADRPPRNS